MTVGTYLRTNDLAQAARMSVQGVRNYEADGLLPAAERSPSGYRRYTPKHLEALLTARHLITAYGRQQAQQIMHAVHGGKLADALALIDQQHAELAGMRRQLAQTLAMLNVLTAQPASEPRPRFGEGVRVGAAARLVGVRVSALRFWEQQGLLFPAREYGSNYRLYNEQQLRRLRIVALLRQANYDFAAIRATLHELEAGQPQRAVAAIEQRRSELARRSWHGVAAIAAVHAYVHEFLVEDIGRLLQRD